LKKLRILSIVAKFIFKKNNVAIIASVIGVQLVLKRIFLKGLYLFSKNVPCKVSLKIIVSRFFVR